VKPGWRKLASRARTTLYRLSTPIDRIVHRRSDVLLPPAHLRIYYYGTWKPEAFAQACERVRTELTSHGLRPEHRVLDIGSGIGNLALGLIGYLRGGYDGLEIHEEAVAWCQKAITPRHPAFRFHRADVASDAYNPDGATPAASYQFPFTDASFDVVFLASVFTHMLPDGVAHYLREISRLLKPGGMCVASYFLLNDDSLAGVRAGRSFMPFPIEGAAGIYRLHDAAVPEAAVAFDEPFIRSIHERAGLAIRDIRRGRWWSGGAHDQDVVTAVRGT
jgi:SAM-dependent methyltransferase